MAKILQREEKLLGYNFNSSSRRDSEVDFSDVFGGPPRCSSSTQEFHNNDIDDDNNNTNSNDNDEEDDGVWFGLMEKPVFGDQIGVRKPYSSGDFYDDIFGGDLPWLSCSLSPTVQRVGQNPLLSAPGSRTMSPSVAEEEEPSAFPSKFSLPGRMTNADIWTSTSMNKNLKFYGHSLFGFDHTIPNHSTLNGSNAHASYQPNSLQHQISFDEKELSSDSKLDRTTDKHEAELIMKDSKGSNLTSNNLQFHFSIYKWANKGIPMIMSSRNRIPSRSKERQTGDAIMVMEDNNRGVNVSDALLLSKHQMSCTPQTGGLVHTSEVVVGGMVAECTLEDEKVENPTNEVGEAHCKGLVGVKECPIHFERGLDAKSIKHFAKLRKFNMKPFRALFGEEKEGNEKATAEKGWKQNIVNETKKSSLNYDVFLRVNKKGKVNESSTGKKDDLLKAQVPGNAKDYASILKPDFSSQVKSNVMGQSSSRWKDTARFEARNEDNSFPMKTRDERQDSYVNLANTWSESIEAVDGEAFITVEPECTIIDSGSIFGSTPNDEPGVDGIQDTASKTSAASVDSNMGIGVVQDVDSHLATDSQELYERKVLQWCKGKEGNIRALLSTMQFVLWPNSGWKPIPLVEIIEANAVKKAYQRALLCLHPDKLQQKGAAPFQKFLAEKIFDILQEAWEEFNCLGMLY